MVAMSKKRITIIAVVAVVAILAITIPLAAYALPVSDSDIASVGL